MPTRVIMPQLGESVVEGTVVRWLKKEGEAVEEMESLLEVNTDKVDTEIPSPAKGVVLKILVPEATTVNAGTLLAWIGEAGETVPGETEGVAAPQKPEVASAPEADHADPVAEEGVTPSPNREMGFISPIVARLAAEHNIDLTAVTGTGEGARITKKDVLAFVEKNAPQPEKAAWETPGSGDLFKPTELMEPLTAPQVELPGGKKLDGITILPLPLIRRQIAAKMVESKQQVPQVTTVMEADLQKVVAHRETDKTAFDRSGIKLTYSAYFFSAAAQALARHPKVNSSWGESGILLRHDIHLGMAVSLGDEGLIVPVIRNADRLSLSGMAAAIQDLADRARKHQLKPEEVQGSTFSVTNHGTGKSLFATPVINPPNCAILGIGAIQKRVVVIGDAIAIRPMVYLTLTFDHRILDGAAADAYLTEVVSILENWSAH